MKVYKSINAIQLALSKSGIAKDRTNSQGATYKFRGIDDVYNAISPLLAEHGLCILPRMLTRICDERISAAGKPLFYVTVEAEFDFVAAEDGSKHIVKTFGEAMDSGDKATNKAMSAAYKYAAFQAFAIPTEGDNDADAYTHQVTPKRITNVQQPEFNESVAADLITAIGDCQNLDELEKAFKAAYKYCVNNETYKVATIKAKDLLKSKLGGLV